MQQLDDNMGAANGWELTPEEVSAHDRSWRSPCLTCHWPVRRGKEHELLTSIVSWRGGGGGRRGTAGMGLGWLV